MVGIQTAAALMIGGIALRGIEFATHRVQLLLERLGATLARRTHTRAGNDECAREKEE